MGLSYHKIYWWLNLHTVIGDISWSSPGTLPPTVETQVSIIVENSFKRTALLRELQSAPTRDFCKEEKSGYREHDRASVPIEPV